MTNTKKTDKGINPNNFKHNCRNDFFAADPAWYVLTVLCSRYVVSVTLSKQQTTTIMTAFN